MAHRPMEMAQKGLTLQDFIELIVRRRRSLIAVFMAGMAVTVAIAFLLPVEFRSSTLILVERQKVPEAYVKPAVTLTIEDRLNNIAQQVTSRRNLEKVIADFKLYPKLRTTRSQEEILELMRKDIELKVMGKDAFELAYSGPDPNTVMQVTNTLASLFIEDNLKVREQLVEDTSEFLETELEIAKRDLEKQEKQLKEFKEKHLGGLPQQMDANLRTLDRLQLELQAIDQSLRNTEVRKFIYPRQLFDGNIAVTGPDPLEAKLEAMEAQLSLLRSEFKENYPDITILKKQISELQREMAQNGRTSKAPEQPHGLSPQGTDTQPETTNSEVNALKERRKSIMATIKEYEKRVESTPNNEQMLLSLIRDYDISQKNYQSLLEKKINAKVSEHLEQRQKGEQFRILDPANLPDKPYKPDRFKILLIGIVLSSGAGFGFVFLLEQLNPSFSKPEDLIGVINLPALVSIPRIPENNDRHREKNKHQRLISIRDPGSMVTDQYRVLYARIHRLNLIKSQKIFAVTSAIQSEGKTTTTLNLAVVMARDFGKKILLIEGDCKKPAFPFYVKEPYSIGLVDVILHKKDVRSAIINFVHDNLWILPAAKSIQNSSALLSSPEMAELINQVRDRYDFILIDSPPILPLSDMGMFAGMVDGILLVVRADKTPRDAVKRAIDSLASDKLIGVVLNDVQAVFLKNYQYDYGRV